jgi:hypothetical protein
VALVINGRALREAGATFFDVVRVGVYVANPADVPTVAEARVEIEVTALERQRRARVAARRAR